MTLKNDRRRWTDKEVALLGTDFDRVIADQIGRTRKAVETERRKRKIKPHRPHWIKWTRAAIRQLGKIPDSAVARQLKIARRTVITERKHREIPAFSPKNRPKWLKKPSLLSG